MFIYKVWSREHKLQNEPYFKKCRIHNNNLWQISPAWVGLQIRYELYTTHHAALQLYVRYFWSHYGCYRLSENVLKTPAVISLRIYRIHNKHGKYNPERLDMHHILQSTGLYRSVRLWILISRYQDTDMPIVGEWCGSSLYWHCLPNLLWIVNILWRVTISSRSRFTVDRLSTTCGRLHVLHETMFRSYAKQLLLGVGVGCNPNKSNYFSIRKFNAYTGSVSPFGILYTADQRTTSQHQHHYMQGSTLRLAQWPGRKHLVGPEKKKEK